MDSSPQFTVPTIIDVPELIVTNDDLDFDEATSSLGNSIWLNKLQFLASTIGYIIGIGNVWHFPHLCYKHAGGAFLLAYTITIIILGSPLFLMELAFGQYANEGPINIWRISPAFEGVGYAMCLISAMVAIYFNVISAWSLHYLFASLTFGQLPWSKCDNSWNTANCILKPEMVNISPVNCTPSVGPTNHFKDEIRRDSSQNASLFNLVNCSESILNSTDEVVLPANEYFHNNLLEITGAVGELGGLNWSYVFCIILVWAVTFMIVLKDFRLTGRASLVAFLMPYLALTAIFIRALSLPGYSNGISYYLTPQWSRLSNIDIWADATTQVFFSLSPCWGGIITLASINKFHNNFHSDALLITTANYVTSLFSGLVVFAILGYMSNYSGVAIDEVADSGLGLIFMVFPEVLSKLPLASLNSVIFFAILLYLGVMSQLTVIETVIKTIVDTWPHKLRYRKPLILMILCAILLLLSLTMSFGNGFYLLQIVDCFAGTHTAMVVGLLELIAIAWVYGMENFMQDIDDMISVHKSLFPSRSYWYFMWRYLSPSFLFAIILFCMTDLPSITYRQVEHPAWSYKLGWILTIVCLSVIPALALVRFLLSPSGSFMDKINYLCRPSEDWAPSSYVSGPKLLHRHMMSEGSFDGTGTVYSGRDIVNPYHDDQDQESNDSNEDLKVVNGKANYIIPEEEDDTDTGLITNETFC